MLVDTVLHTPYIVNPFPTYRTEALPTTLFRSVAAHGTGSPPPVRIGRQKTEILEPRSNTESWLLLSAQLR
jgi:hypothetical protein